MKNITKNKPDTKILLGIHRIVKIGNAMGITLPKDWIEVNNVKAGDKVLIKAEVIK